MPRTHIVLVQPESPEDEAGLFHLAEDLQEAYPHMLGDAIRLVGGIQEELPVETWPVLTGMVRPRQASRNHPSMSLLTNLDPEYRGCDFRTNRQALQEEVGASLHRWLLGRATLPANLRYEVCIYPVLSAGFVVDMARGVIESEWPATSGRRVTAATR